MPPHDADVVAACTAALVDVAENSFFAFVVPTASAQFLEGVERQPSAESPVWMTASLEFTGAFRGRLTIDLPTDLARSLRASFLGLSPDEEDGAPPLPDTVGEFLNQVCGMWLTTACQDRCFDLGRPDVLSHPAGWRPPRDARGVVMTYEVDDRPLRLAVDVTTVP